MEHFQVDSHHHRQTQKYILFRLLRQHAHHQVEQQKKSG
jgi:hypothetical protein